MSTWTAAWKVTKPISDLEKSEMEWVPHHLLAYGGVALQVKDLWVIARLIKPAVFCFTYT